MATFKAIVFQTGRHIKQDGTSNIKIRIYHNRESQDIATSYYIQPENMDDSKRIPPNVTNGEMIEYEINAYIQMNDYLCKIKRILIINPVRN